jgi:hypothetical protein
VDFKLGHYQIDHLLDMILMRVRDQL